MGLNKLRVAIIGCGRIGTLTKPERKAMMPSGTVPINHAEAIISNTSLQLVALCDVDKANLDRASKAYEVEKCFNDYKALILDVKPDIISIATRTLGRCDIIKFAVENGVKGIHIEKPISTNLAECREVIEVAKKHQVYLTYGTARRFMDIYIRAKEILASGEIGELVQISIELGYTLLLWNHPHSVDMLIFFAECMDIEYVQSSCVFNSTPSTNTLIIDDDPFVESALIKFKNGVTGLITSRAGGNVTLCGTEGNLIIAADGSWLELQKRGDKSPYFLENKRLNVEALMSGTQRVFFDLANAIQYETALSITPEEIELSQKILLSIAYSSLKDGRRIDISKTPEKFTVTGKFGDKYA